MDSSFFQQSWKATSVIQRIDESSRLGPIHWQRKSEGRRHSVGHQSFRWVMTDVLIFRDEKLCLLLLLIHCQNLSPSEVINTSLFTPDAVPVSSDDPSASVYAPTASFATTTSGYASNNESLLRSAALPSTTASAAFYSAIPPVEFHADPSASGDIPFTASSTEEAPFAFASTSAASSPLRVVFRPEFGVTLRQNPLSDEMVQPGHAGVTAACQQQDQDEGKGMVLLIDGTTGCTIAVYDGLQGIRLYLFWLLSSRSLKVV